MKPAYNLDKIRFATDPATFEKAVALYDNGKVIQFREELNGFFATVMGTKPYKVYIDRRHYDQGDCECYLGQNNMLCKHMVAVAVHAVMRGKKLNKKDKLPASDLVCSGKLGELSEEELVFVKKSITDAMKYIKPYNGPSRIWFSYQNSLDEGCARLSKLASDLPVSGQTTKLLVDLLLRLDKKLCTGGVDDSDGTVGGFMEETVQMLKEYAKLDPSCAKVFDKLKNKDTCFGWEETLLKLLL